MRIFKFRVWDKKLNKFHFSGFSLTLDGVLTHSDGSWSWDFDTNYIIQQSTGMTDKNGKDIYEGDILKWPEGWVYFETLGEVKWLTNGYYFENQYVMMLLPEVIYAKIVGNIFENPELLK